MKIDGSMDNVPVKKEGVEALFKFLRMEMENMKENEYSDFYKFFIYISWGVPRCVKLDIKMGWLGL